MPRVSCVCTPSSFCPKTASLFDVFRSCFSPFVRALWPFNMQDFFRFKNGPFHQRKKIFISCDSKRSSFITDSLELQFDTATLIIPSFRMIKARGCKQRFKTDRHENDNSSTAHQFSCCVRRLKRLRTSPHSPGPQPGTLSTASGADDAEDVGAIVRSCRLAPRTAPAVSLSLILPY